MEEWRNSPTRKPLLLDGIRQVGKTWALKEFGRRAYDNLAYFPLDRDPDARQLFENTKDPYRLVRQLSLLTRQPINPATTLLVIDEIQRCGPALESLKYFCEEAPEYHVAAAGSLLGVSMSGTSYPVGKVDTLAVRPMTFSEFLAAAGEQDFLDYLTGIDALIPIPDVFFNRILELFREYLATGGMPEPLNRWLVTGDISRTDDALREILLAYERDFAKHAPAQIVPKIRLVWQSLPSQLARENKKFLYKTVKPGARAREYEDAIQWIVDAGLAEKIYRSTGPGIPVAAYDEVDAFKLYLPDVGLLRRQANLPSSVVVRGNELFTEFKGSLAENYILQALECVYEGQPRYWAEDNPRHEVDFLVQHGTKVIPIEVKSGTSVKSTSMKAYRRKFQEKVPISVRFSLRNLRLDGDVLCIPLFMADWTDKLIDLALAQLN
jgi:predicted AAA+ superfamily ATPase